MVSTYVDHMIVEMGESKHSRHEMGYYYNDARSVNAVWSLIKSHSIVYGDNQGSSNAVARSLMVIKLFKLGTGNTHIKWSELSDKILRNTDFQEPCQKKCL